MANKPESLLPPTAKNGGASAASSTAALALSTALGKAQVAAFDRTGRIFFEFEIVEYQEQSQRLLGELSEQMRLAGLTGDQVEAIAVNVGPGGFTSLRTACGVGQGLAAAWGSKCLLINSFDMVAQAAESSGLLANSAAAADAPLAVALDAKLGELYFAQTSERAPAQPSSQWTEMKLVSQKPEVLKDCMHSLGQILTDSETVASLFEQAGLGSKLRVVEVAASSMVGPALKTWNAGEFHEPLAFQPLYIREKVAETTQERMARKHGQV